jgi:hypothetical protein
MCRCSSFELHSVYRKDSLYFYKTVKTKTYSFRSWSSGLISRVTASTTLNMEAAPSSETLGDTSTITRIPYFLGPCHHGTARPGVPDGGDRLQIWMVSENILDKRSRQPIRGSPSAWGLGEGLETRHKNTLVTTCYTGPRTWTDILEGLANNGR